MRMATSILMLAICLAAGATLLACSSGSSGTTSPTSENSTPAAAAVEQEINPPGDIPDNQVFVSYHSDAGGYTLDIPEGWSRTESGPNVGFADKLDSINVEIYSRSAAPTVDSVSNDELPQLAQQTEAFAVVEIKAVDLPVGRAVRIRYQANSAPDEVTGKKVRLEVDRYEVFKDGKVAAISLAAPAGSDNVDVWKQIADSFTWA